MLVFVTKNVSTLNKEVTILLAAEKLKFHLLCSVICYRLVVCCVSVVSGLEDIMNRTIQTSKGGTKLVDLENHVYRLD